VERRHAILIAATWILAGCSDAQRPEATRKLVATAGIEEPGPTITQLYTTIPHLERGEKAMVCYGVMNARTVWLEPPRQELSAALSRCVEVSPAEDTTYKLTAEGGGGKTATREVKISVGAGRPKIANVTVSALEVTAGDLVSICWEASNANTATVAPLNYHGPGTKGCATDQPRKSTTYVITVAGAGGQRDQEKVSVKVR
jgi:hypothetical protein